MLYYYRGEIVELAVKHGRLPAGIEVMVLKFPSGQDRLPVDSEEEIGVSDGEKGFLGYVPARCLRKVDGPVRPGWRVSVIAISGGRCNGK